MEIEFDISHGIVLKHTNNISIQLIRIFANVLEIPFPFFRFYGEYVSLFDYNSFHVCGNVETCITSILILNYSILRTRRQGRHRAVATSSCQSQTILGETV